MTFSDQMQKLYIVCGKNINQFTLQYIFVPLKMQIG